MLTNKYFCFLVCLFKRTLFIWAQYVYSDKAEPPNPCALLHKCPNAERRWISDSGEECVCCLCSFCKWSLTPLIFLHYGLHHRFSGSRDQGEREGGKEKKQRKTAEARWMARGSILMQALEEGYGVCCAVKHMALLKCTSVTEPSRPWEAGYKPHSSFCTLFATVTSLIKAALPASPSRPSPVCSAVLYKVLRLRFHACVSYTAGCY